MTDNERANLLLRLEALVDKISHKSITDLEKDTLKALERIVYLYTTSDNLTDRQRRLLITQALNEELKPAYKQLGDQLIADMQSMGEWTGLFLSSTYNESPVLKALHFNDKTLIHGYELGDMINTNKSDNIKQFKRIIAQGITEGKHPTTVHRELKKSHDKRLAHVSDVVVSSAMKEARVQAQYDVIDKLMKAGVITELEYSATLEANTCAVCAALDGKRFKSREALPPFPIHFRCRCVIIERTDETRGRRAGIQYNEDGTSGGKQFASMDYYTWLSHQSKAVQHYVKSRHKISNEKFRELMGQGLGKKAKMPPSARVTKMRAKELELIHNKYETAMIIDKHGNIMETIKGGERSVVIPESISNIHTLSHNHPQATSFSAGDVGLFFHKKMRRMRAVGKIGNRSVIYEMKIKEDFVFPGAGRMTVMGGQGGMASDRYNTIMDSLYPKYNELLKGRFKNQGKKAFLRHTHETMQKLSKEFGFEYTRTFEKIK